MTIKELSDKEIEIYKHVHSIHDSIDDTIEILKDLGIFDEYRKIHNHYLSIISSTVDEIEKNEALKRIIFLNWFHIIEPSFLTDILELDGDTIYNSYLVLNDYIVNNKIDKEFTWMLSYVIAQWDWIILIFSEKDMLALTAFVKSVDKSKHYLPKKEILNKTMEDRGLMGEFFKNY